MVETDQIVTFIISRMWFCDAHPQACDELREIKGGIFMPLRDLTMRNQQTMYNPRLELTGNKGFC